MALILIADDHPVLRNGIVYLVKTKLVFANIIEAIDGKDALEKILRLNPDLALLDFDMPHLKGIEVCRRMKKAGSSAKAVMLTMHNDANVFNESMEAGMNGFLLKDNALDEITECIQDVLAGKNYVSPKLTPLLQKREQKEKDLKGHELLHSLTHTEFKILQLIAKGTTSRQIADLHFISIRTVDNHRANICKKLNLKGNNALLMYVTINRHLFM
ncbi:MAG TPA: response regulator transcription factor [Flavobacteriales bacterium]|nr:response regulator transcription factor [Flavobacteriales bacterium]